MAAIEERRPLDPVIADAAAVHEGSFEPEAVQLCEKYGILSEHEMHSRYERPS